MEVELEHRHALDRLRLDVLDAGDVEEVVLVVADDLPSICVGDMPPNGWTT
jgi:hypothetical protein